MWRHLAESLAWQIDIGRLSPGDRVPSTRTLARLLGTSRSTVALAYDELWSRGYLRQRVGDGSYVGPVEERTRALAFERMYRVCESPEGTLLVLIR